MRGGIFSSNTKCCPCYRYDRARTEIQLTTLQERCVLMLNKASDILFTSRMMGKS